MNDRVSRIISQIRLNLGESETNAIQPGEIFEKSTLIQNEILLETKCKDASIIILLTKNKEDYPVDHIQDIVNVYNSWGGRMVHKDKRSEYLQIPTTGLTNPAYFNFFNERIWLRPITTRDGETVTLEGKQISVIHDMDNDVPPEIPPYADNCLISGVCAIYNPERFMAEYLERRVSVSAQKNFLSHGKSKGMNW